MPVRQSPLSKIESFMQRIVETPFARLFPSKLEPVELARRLERSMEDNLLQSVERRLAPNVYDIYLSMKDHQRLAPGQAILIKDLQDHLVTVARQRHYTLRSVPLLRLHSDSSLSTGAVHIEAGLVDRQHMGPGDASIEGGAMATQSLSPEQLAQLRAQLPAGIQPLGIPSQQELTGAPLQQAPLGVSHNPSASQLGTVPANPSNSFVGAVIPQARLTISLPQAAQQIYHIEKPIINIGRQLSNDIIVEDKRVSRYHAQIKYQADGQFAIFDLGSTNGITINRIPNQRQHTLRSGDHFTIGNYNFYFERR